MGGRMNWSAANSRTRIQQHGAEGILPSGNGRSGTTQQARKRTVMIGEPVIIDKFWKNRGGDAVYVRLAPYEGRNLIDVRTWRADGHGISGRDFFCDVRHLPKLANALAKALNRARELKLIEDEGDE